MTENKIFYAITKENLAKITDIINKEPDLKVTDNVGNTLLHAVFQNKELNQIQMIHILKILLHRGLDINAKNRFEKTVLHLAIERRYRDVIDFCIQQNADLNVTSSEGNTIAHYIIEEECRKFHLIARNENLVELEDESLSFVDWMWSKGIDFFYERNQKNQSAVYLAIELNLQHILLTLLNSIPNFSVVEKNKKPLLCAFLKRNGNSDGYIKHKTLTPINSFYYKHRHIYNIVKVLLEKNVSMSNKTLNAALLIAIKSEEPLKILELILQRITCVVNIDGESLIQTFTYIICSKHKVNWSIEERMKILQELVYKGADINERDELQKTIASKWFIHHPKLEIVQLLKKCGTNFNIPLIDDGTFLHLISRFGNEFGMVELLLNEKCNVNMLNSLGEAPLHIAIINKNTLVAWDLIQYGANVDIVDFCHRTPLYFACETGQARIVEKLIEHNADLECRDFYKNSLMHIAANNAEIVELLIKNGANVNARNYKGQTPLHLTKNSDVVPILFNAGALVDSLNNDGHTPLWCSFSQECCEKVVELLKCGLDIRDPKVYPFVLCHFRFPSSVYRDPMQYLVEHLVKLTAAGLFEKMSGFCEESERLFIVFFKNCQREIEFLKDFLLDNSTSLYKFLHKNPNRRCAYVDNEKLRKLVENSRIVQTSFPMYFVVILGCYNEAKTRKPLLQRASCILKNIGKVSLPDLCIDNILVYLSNMDLWQLIRAAKRI